VILVKTEPRAEDLETFIENHPVFYIRHNMDSTKQVYSKLMSEGFIAVHYGGELRKGVDTSNLKNLESPDSYGKTQSLFSRDSNDVAKKVQLSSQITATLLITP
jgi:hypothetical protein